MPSTLGTLGLAFLLGVLSVLVTQHLAAESSGASSMDDATPTSARRLASAGSSGYSSGQLDHLPNCDLPQSPSSLADLAKKHRASKFGYVRPYKNVESGKNPSQPWVRKHAAVAGYERAYPTWLEEYRYKRFRLLEIGLESGRSLHTWLEYFPCAEIHGVDLYSEKTKFYGTRPVRTHAMNAGNPAKLRALVEQAGVFDVIIDDGGHNPIDQITAYSILFDVGLSPGGLYVIEDIETSFWKPGSRLYKAKIGPEGGCAEQRPRRNAFETFAALVRKVAAGKFTDPTAVVVGPIDHWVRSISFSQDIVILRKKTALDCFAELKYRDTQLLDQSCPAHKQEQPSGAINPFWRFCEAHGKATYPVDEKGLLYMPE